ncbi:2-oxoglutarate ferredoxin oxidoreductase subunit beta [Halanaerobium saccharolyticum]|jgi:2-oxoglutarate ferredoxin oxidoreductase subunit beta|uniref:2-oxoglutarate ferredoxin oxidoreductase subunit beta n=1 Tax=Halanaerobium saccharolyticum TaxID=43595 RepID=A0A2T5RKL1_9FIRM|nr:thiamine pyrophosphate-dependent enzyme [Halanaerobium saccharolyticum]OEG63610.1 MAG: 2-oxoacid ferredoxin oxidoreductase [Halanaerobium sp. MDAL1]PTV99556.1 2-oxoglutarate ferredoxin oxidoreductase subunit beta [Halanaerobium saccharolyticum]PUU95762.1 MAG: 2-oxoglutarate ferredoxin oxidoreductase subunit beta [Halanaerobium sp.]
MVDKNIYQADRETAWCPGCGNFPLRTALADALAEMDLKPEEVTMYTGIGQAAKMPHYIKVNGFNGLHGRSLPPAIGMRVANPKMTVIVESGDGCSYGEGGNHILHNIRRNPDIIHLVHDNQIYGLTKGQASPTSVPELRTPVQTHGVNAEPLNPVQFAVGMKASFVARSSVGDREHLKEMIREAKKHKGYALIDIFQPCVSFNKINTYQWYNKRVYKLEDHDPTDHAAAMKVAQEFGDKIPIGIIYREEKPTFRDRMPYLEDKALVERDVEVDDLKFLIDEFK